MKTPTLSSLNGLADIGLRSGVDMRPTLIRVLTDLYVQKLAHTADEERHYPELALRLLDGGDATIAGELNDLFFTADEHARRLILLNLHVVAPLSPGQVAVLRDPGIGQRL